MNCVVTGRDYHPLNPFYLDKQKPNLSDTVKNLMMVQCGTVGYVFIPYCFALSLLCMLIDISQRNHLAITNIVTLKKSSPKIATYPKHMYITLHLSTFFESW